MNRYFVNPGNEPTYIIAKWVQICKGKLQFYGEDSKLIREFKLNPRLHFDNLSNMKVKSQTPADNTCTCDEIHECQQCFIQRAKEKEIASLEISQNLEQ